MDLTEKYPTKNPKTAWRIIEGETLIVNPLDRMIHHLNPVGARSWELSDGKKRVKEIVSQIYQEFEVDYETAKRDILEFLQELVAKEIMTLEEISGEMGA